MLLFQLLNNVSLPCENSLLFVFMLKMTLGSRLPSRVPMALRFPSILEALLYGSFLPSHPCSLLPDASAQCATGRKLLLKLNISEQHDLK